MWALPQKVRDVVGIDTDAICTDRQLEEVIRIAQEKVKEELFTYHYRETVENSRAGKTWDGSNTTFNTADYPIMDSNYDFTVDSNDVNAEWIDNNYNPQVAKVTVSNATYGILTITQTNSSAIPSNADDVTVTYYSCNRNVSRQHLENLTTLWAAHLLNGMMDAGTSISMADFQKNRMLILQNPSQWKDKYYELLSQLQSGKAIRGV